MRKIGFIVLALVLALGSLGIGYAAWTDELKINGTVNTGTVDINIVGYSWTLVYKIEGLGETPWGRDICVVHERGPADAIPDPANPPDPPDDCWDGRADWWLVAWAIAEPAYDAAGDLIDDAAKMTFHNLFPSIDFVADIIIHYNGTIPVKVNVAEITTNDAWLALLYEQQGAWLMGYEWIYDPDVGFFPGEVGTFIPYAEGVQLHQCEAAIVEIGIHLPQRDELQDQEASFIAYLEVVQWNEYPYAP